MAWKVNEWLQNFVLTIDVTNECQKIKVIDIAHKMISRAVSIDQLRPYNSQCIVGAIPIVVDTPKILFI